MLKSFMAVSLVAAAVVVAVPIPAAAQAMPAEYQQVLSTLGKRGDFKDSVLKVNIPRSDVNVTVAGVATPTPFGFGGWVAMTKGTDGQQVLGEQAAAKPRVQVDERVEVRRVGERSLERRVEAIRQPQLRHVVELGDRAGGCDEVQPRRVGGRVEAARLDVEPDQSL